MVSQTVNMSNPYANQLYNTQNMYQQQQPLMTLEAHHKPLSQIMYVTVKLLTLFLLVYYCNM
jgi:hypothetical protein